MLTVDMEVMRFTFYGKVLAEAELRLNFPMEDKSHNLQMYVVDPPSTMATAKKCNYWTYILMMYGKYFFKIS